MALPPISLNKLVILREVLRLQSVSAAASALGRAQPSVSIVLQDMRSHYDDRLLVRTGNDMQLTPFGEQLCAELDSWHASTFQIVDRRKGFDPRTAERTFTLIASDYQLAILAPAISSTVENAPGIDVHILSPVPEALVGKATYSETVRADFTAQTRTMSGDSNRKAVEYEDKYVVYFDPTVRAAPASLDEFCASNFVLASPTGRGTNLVDTALAETGRRRNIRHRTRQILGAAHLVKGTPLLTVLPAGLAPLIGGLGLAQTSLELDLQPLVTALIWPERLEEDLAHTWFRHAVATSLKQTLD